MATAAVLPGDELTVQALAAYDGEKLGGAFPYDVVRDLPDPVARGRLRRARSLANATRRVIARRRLLRRYRPDVLHIQTLVYELDAIDLPRLAQRRPLVAVVHDVKPHVPRLPVSIQNWCHRRVYRSGADLVVYHDWVADRLVEEFGVDRSLVHVLPLPLDAHRSISPTTPGNVVLFFGSLRPNKGLEVLLGALQEFEGEDVRCVIAGSGDTAIRRKLEEAASRSSVLQLELGTISDERKWELFESSSVVVLPYVAFESQSGVLADAYAARRPVVVTDVGALGHTVREDGTGFVVPAGDTQSLATGLRTVMQSPESYRAALDEAAARHDRAVVGGLLREVYDKAVARRARHHEGDGSLRAASAN